MENDNEDNKYHCWVHVSETNNIYGSTARNVEAFFEIVTNHEGVIEFKGLPLFGTSKVSQSQWENDKGVLEEAMGKAYRHPQKRFWSDYANKDFYDSSQQR